MNIVDPWLIWFLIGLALVLSEFAIPGVILVFFGIGAWTVSLLTGVGLLGSTGAQVAVFGATSIVLLFTLRRLFKGWFIGRTRHTSSGADNLDEYVGKTATALEDIPSGGRGKVEFKGAHWNAHTTTPLAEGERATITGLDGLTLTVEKS